MTDPRPTAPILVDQTPLAPVDSIWHSLEPLSGGNDASIFLRVPEPSEPNQLGWLPRLLGLETYSAALLTKKVRVELSVLAMILGVVFLFELLAWSFFFNGLFTGNMTTPRGLGTAVAVALGLLFAGTILYFERQVLTVDSYSLGRSQRIAAALVRIVFILVGGYVVAHAVDLLVFRIPVAKALHLEAATVESIRLQEDLSPLAHDLISARRTALALDLAFVREQLKEVRENRTNLLGAQERAREGGRVLQPDVERARAFVRQAEQDIARLGRDDDSTTAHRTLEDARRHYISLLKDLRGTRGDLGAADVSLQDIDRRIHDLTTEESEIETQRVEITRYQEQVERLWGKLDQRRRAWIAELERSEPGDRIENAQGWLDQIPEEEKELVPRTWLEPLEFQEPERSFFEQLEALYAVVFQGPAGSRWKDPYHTSWWGVHLAAIFIPFIVLVSKWILMSREVDAYYSTAHQAHAGDADARLMVKVEKDVVESKHD